MPRGIKAADFPAPAETWCDFCGRRFKPLAWNERTCYRCGVAGCPNQSKLPWGEYQRALYKFLRSIGKRAKLTGHAASLSAGQTPRVAASTPKKRAANPAAGGPLRRHAP